MGALPRAKAGIGSAMNDVVREVGGTLGIAVLGSVLTSCYGSAMDDDVAGLPGLRGRRGDRLASAPRTRSPRTARRQRGRSAARRLQRRVRRTAWRRPRRWPRSPPSSAPSSPLALLPARTQTHDAPAGADVLQPAAA